MVKVPYHKSFLEFDVDEQYIAGVLTSGAHDYAAQKSVAELISHAMSNPIGSPELSALSAGKKNILVITSDHTRPVPSHLTLPVMLRELRKGNPDANIRILIATGFHRKTTREEMADKFGSEIAANEIIINHDSRDEEGTTYLGLLPSGGELWINSLAVDADLIVADGFIEPHFFAGFSGGRKSVMPGIVSQKTVFSNHCSKFIADPLATTGNLEGNPIHADMVFAARKAGLAFILNVVIDENKDVIGAFAGDFIAAHEAGCAFLRELAAVKRVESDIVITSNGGYPLDQNIYQAVKGMSAAEKCVKTGGVIIIAASCVQGHGGEGFYDWFRNNKTAKEIQEKILAIPQMETLPDQWEAQILARILLKARVIIVSDMVDEKLVSDMKMTLCKTPDEALLLARKLTSRETKITIIPDGVSVIIE